MPDADKIVYADTAEASRITQHPAESPTGSNPQAWQQLPGSSAIVLTRRAFLANAGTLIVAAGTGGSG